MIRPREWSSATRTLSADRVAALGLPGLRQAGPRRLQPRASPGSTTSPTSRRAIEAAQVHDPKVLVEAGHRRPRDRVRACWGADGGERPRASLPGEIVVDRRRPRVLRLRGEVPRRGPASGSTCPPTSRRRRAREVRDARGADVRGDRRRGARPGRRLRDPRRRGGRQRDQHDARASPRSRCTPACGRPRGWRTPISSTS